MDSPAVVLENSSGFLSVPPRMEICLHVLLLQHQILSLKTLQLSYFSILVAFFNKNGSHRACQKYVLMDFLVEFTRKYKSTKIGECAGVPRNYSIFKLKLYQNLTSAQVKNGSPSSLDSSLDSKRKNTLKIRLHRLN